MKFAIRLQIRGGEVLYYVQFKRRRDFTPTLEGAKFIPFTFEQCERILKQFAKREVILSAEMVSVIPRSWVR